MDTMWDLGNLWAEVSKNTSMAAGSSSSMVASPSSYLSVMNEIHVLLVDHDSDGLTHTAKLLESCQYRVTHVEYASSAITMLTNGKVKYDIVMANVNSPDLHGFKLVQDAAKMNIPVIFMSIDDNAFMALRAVEFGAFLYMKKPATKEMMSFLWQYVTRERMKLMPPNNFINNNINNVRGVEIREVVHHTDYQNPNNNIVYGNNMMMNNMVVMNDKGNATAIMDMPGIVNGVLVDNQDIYDSEERMLMISNNNRVKRKVCTEWTQELHEKFMEAVEELGDGRCFPKEILELMKVPGLTRMQVASHLQKCRNDNWRSPQQRKASLAVQAVSTDSGGTGYKPRRFGSMPKLGKTGVAPSSHRMIQDGGPHGSKTLAESEIVIESQVENTVNMGSVVMAGDGTPHHHYGGSSSVNAGSGGGVPAPPPPAGAGMLIYSTNPRHPSDDFFSFDHDMDCLIQNFAGNNLAAGSTPVNDVADTSVYHYEDPVYNQHHEQNCNNVAAAVNVESGGAQWNSDTSNFESDDSGNRGN
ncbi:hypothetical protein ABFS82_09G123100 [Erythranthe guttata]